MFQGIFKKSKFVIIIIMLKGNPCFSMAYNIFRMIDIHKYQQQIWKTIFFVLFLYENILKSNKIFLL